jgi:hypothetical protein
MEQKDVSYFDEKKLAKHFTHFPPSYSFRLCCSTRSFLMATMMTSLTTQQNL